MAIKNKKVTKNNQTGNQEGTVKSKSFKVSSKGIKTSRDFANLMSALMSDLIEGCITPQVGNATCNAGGKLLKIVELQYKYGHQKNGKKVLNLAQSTLD